MPAYYTIAADGTKQWRYRKRGVVAANGKKITVNGRPAINTKVAAEAEERAHINRVQGIVPQAPKPEPEPSKGKRGSDGEPTIEELIEPAIDWYNRTPGRVKRKPRTGRTKDSTRDLLRGAILPSFGPLRIGALDQNYVDSIVNMWLAIPNSPRTINRKLTALSNLIEYAKAIRGITRPDVTLRVAEPENTNEIKPYERDEIDALLKAALSDQRYRVAFLLGSDAGLRIGEIRGLMHADINRRVSPATIRVRRSIDTKNRIGPPKGGKEREVPISDALLVELDALPKRGMYVIPCLDVDSEKLRGEARKRAHASGAFMGYFGMLGAAHRYAKAAGLESDERSLRDENKSPWHSLRHTFGVELARAGVGIEDIAELMGHADIETARIYTKFASNARTKAEAIARAFNNRT